jgi:hypothetical protein
MILGHSRIVRDLDRGRNMGCKDFPDTIGLVRQCRAENARAGKQQALGAPADRNWPI